MEHCTKLWDDSAKYSDGKSNFRAGSFSGGAGPRYSNLGTVLYRAAGGQFMVNWAAVRCQLYYAGTNEWDTAKSDANDRMALVHSAIAKDSG